MRRYHCFFLPDAVFSSSRLSGLPKKNQAGSLLCSYHFVQCCMYFRRQATTFLQTVQCNQLNNIEKLYCLSTYDYKYFASVVKENRRRNIDLMRRPSRLFTLKLNPVTHGIMKELLETKHIILVCIFIVLYCL